jgi:hypothetical protein
MDHLDQSGTGSGAEATAATVWHIRRGDSSFIAPTLDLLRDWCREGRIVGTDNIWHPSFGQHWRLARDVAEISAVLHPRAPVQKGEAGPVQANETRAHGSLSSNRTGWRTVRRVLGGTVLAFMVVFIGLLALAMWLQHDAAKNAAPHMSTGQRALEAKDWPTAARSFNTANIILGSFGPVDLRHEARMLEASAIAMTGDESRATELFLQIIREDPARRPSSSEPLVTAAFQNAQDKISAIEAAHRSQIREAEIARQAASERQREDAYLLMAAPSAYGAMASVYSLADKVRASDSTRPLNSLVEIYLVADRAEQVVDFFCAKYQPSTVPPRFDSSDRQIKTACSKYKEGLREVRSSRDEARMLKAWELLSSGIADSDQALKSFMPYIKERNLDTKQVVTQWAAEFEAK